MTVYVFRDGKYVDKATLYRHERVNTGFPTPRLSRFDSFESPITGEAVTSWRQRDREMNEHDCYDPRDLPADHVYRRGREVQLAELEEVRANGERTDDTFQWNDTGTGE
jgi:hypothetical protein